MPRSPSGCRCIPWRSPCWRKSGPLVVTTANQPGMPAPVDVDDAVAQLGDAIGLALDAGDLSGAEPLPSTVVDVTGDQPRVVRIGAIPVERLRRVCPHVLADEGSVTA